LQGVEGIRRAGPVDLDPRSAKVLIAFDGKPRQPKARFRIGVCVLAFAVRGLIRGKEKHLIQLAANTRFFGDKQMPEVNRIERAAH